jgi:hypothetical protein
MNLDRHGTCAGPRLPDAKRFEAELPDESRWHRKHGRAGVDERVIDFDVPNLLRPDGSLADLVKILEVLDPNP